MGKPVVAARLAFLSLVSFCSVVLALMVYFFAAAGAHAVTTDEAAPPEIVVVRVEEGDSGNHEAPGGGQNLDVYGPNFQQELATLAEELAPAWMWVLGFLVPLALGAAIFLRNSDDTPD